VAIELKIEIPFPKLDLLEPPLQIKMENAELLYFDGMRSKWLVLTPEEWVRQHVLYWLITQTGWPTELLAVERLVKGSGKRSDVVGYDRAGSPTLLVECKAPDVLVNEETARQAIQYNQKLNCPYLWLSNGLVHFVLKMEYGKFIQIKQLPDFKNLIN
jgi:hypothetical protein